MRMVPMSIRQSHLWLRLGAFERKVLAAVYSIPVGEVRTYFEIAKIAGKHKAVRAAANAIAKNPFAPEIPCHRVVRSDGCIGGYSAKGGVAKKIEMLRAEGIEIRNKRLMKK